MITFMKCLKCGNIMIFLENSGVTPSCCGGPMTKVTPQTTDGPSEKHVPVVKLVTAMEGNELIRMVSVDVGEVAHPMEKEHYVKWIILETNKATHIRRLNFGEKPRATFMLAKDENPIAAYEYCNIHGIWMADV